MRTCIVLLVALFAVSCSCSDNQTCLKGKAVISSCCTGTTVVALTSSEQLGDTVSVNGVQYYNAIQITGEFPKDEMIYFKARAFDTKKDELGVVCYCLVAEPWVELPIYIITDRYNESCNKQADL